MAVGGKLAWVSELDLRAGGGGSYAVNWHAFHGLGRQFDACYCGPVRVRVPRVDAWISKLRRRVLGMPGSFVRFSPVVLERTALEVGRMVPADAGVMVFRSAAPWVRCRPRVPYHVYLDVGFHTFFHNTFSPGDFVAGDLERIWREEGMFLRRAEGVFFESRWGMERACEAYGLDVGKCHVAGRGGVLEPPERDAWDGGAPRLLTIAKRFRQKGGDLVLEAYRRLKPAFPGLTWHIVGGAPEGDLRGLEGIVHEGVLDPGKVDELERLRGLLAGAFLLVHPTREDTNPLVLTEAAYFGCPAVSVRRFAIPELVKDGVGGILLDPPVEAGRLAEAVAELLRDRERYLRMREAARAAALRSHTWDKVVEVMAKGIRRSAVGGLGDSDTHRTCG